LEVICYVGELVHLFAGANVVVWWWIQNIRSVDTSFLEILSSGGIVGSSYMMVSAAKWAIMCVSENGPVYGLKLWYQSISFEIIRVIVFGSFLATIRAQWMACCKSVALWGWA
jgi:hypothetical protein